MSAAFDLPRNVMFPVHKIRLRLQPGRHPYEAEHGAAIDRNWTEELEKNPALFDGRVALLSSVAYAGGDILGTCHEVRFATLMHWRRNRRSAGAEHIYAHAMPVSSDNALIAVRMGPHTASAGRVYFAAGSFDAEDFRDGFADVEGNMAREVLEETGIDLSPVPRDENYHAWSGDNGTVVVRRYFPGAAAEDVAERVARHVAADPEPEITGAVIIRGPDDVPENLAPHMRPLIDWHFSNPPR